ncbi:MAG: hypothetical protein QXM43_06180 [Desulfurococcaceae archaeon]
MLTITAGIAISVIATDNKQRLLGILITMFTVFQVIMSTVIEKIVFGLENLNLSREEIEKRVNEVLESTGFKGR